jgi:hypothetical protein
MYENRVRNISFLMEYLDWQSSERINLLLVMLIIMVQASDGPVPTPQVMGAERPNVAMAVILSGYASRLSSRRNTSERLSARERDANQYPYYTNARV